MNKIHIFGIILGILLCCCDRMSDPSVRVEVGRTAAEQLDASSQEYLIYSFLLDELTPSLRGRSVVISDLTTTYSLPYANLEEAVSTLREKASSDVSVEVYRDFLKRNEQPVRLVGSFHSETRYELVTSEELISTFQHGDGWATFNRRFPGHALIEFSRIGFDANTGRALVYVSSRGGPKTGQGNYFLLEEDNGKWVIQQKIESWTS